jgi:DNA-binding transcriptional ArsR family regulator
MVNKKTAFLNNVFHALADPTRRQILFMLLKHDRPASELAAGFNMSFPAVSKHLKVLEKAQLIERRITGRTHHFYIRQQAMKKAFRWIQGYEGFWLKKLDNLDKHLKP